MNELITFCVDSDFLQAISFIFNNELPAEIILNCPFFDVYRVLCQPFRGRRISDRDHNQSRTTLYFNQQNTTYEMFNRLHFPFNKSIQNFQINTCIYILDLNQLLTITLNNNGVSKNAYTMFVTLKDLSSISTITRCADTINFTLKGYFCNNGISIQHLLKRIEVKIFTHIIKKEQYQYDLCMQELYDYLFLKYC